MKTLHDLFEHTLKDIYYAEGKLVRALPKLAKEAEHPALKAALEAHAKETVEQIKMLDKVFKLIDVAPKGEKCDAIEGLIKEGDGVVEDAKSPLTLDLGMIGCCQAVEHYEMARYSSLISWAEQLGLDEAAGLLSQILEQEVAADEKLAAISEEICGSAIEDIGEDDDGDDEKVRKISTSAKAKPVGDGRVSGKSAKS